MREVVHSLGIQTKKCNTLARFLVETPGQGDIIFNENLRQEVETVLLKLQALIGNYCLYRPQGSDFDDDPNYAQEDFLQKLVLQYFSTSRETLTEALKCEDYDEQGILDLAQMVEAISSVNEEVDETVLNYMLYYVLVRS